MVPIPLKHNISAAVAPFTFPVVVMCPEAELSMVKLSLPLVPKLKRPASMLLIQNSVPSILILVPSALLDPVDVFCKKINEPFPAVVDLHQMEQEAVEAVMDPQVIAAEDKAPVQDKVPATLVFPVKAAPLRLALVSN